MNIRNASVILWPTIAAATALLLGLFLEHTGIPMLRHSLVAVAVFAIVFAAVLPIMRLRSALRQARSANRKLSDELDRSRSATTGLETLLKETRGEAAALRRSGAITERYVDSAAMLIALVTPDRQVAMINRKACHVLGCMENDALGMNWFDAFVAEPARRDAEEAFVALVGAESGNEKHTTSLMVSKDGIQRIVRWHCSLARDEDGAVAGVLYVGEDVTERIQSDAADRNLNERRARALQMESVARLAADVAVHLERHVKPIADGVSSILAGLDDLATEHDVTDLRDKALGLAGASSDAGAMVKYLTALGRRTECLTAPVSLNNVVARCLKSREFIELAAKHPGITIKTDAANDLLTVSGDEQMLSNALVATIKYCFEAMPEGGELSIATSNFYSGEDVVKYEPIPAGEYALLWMGHNGAGMTEDQIERLFEPFCLSGGNGPEGAPNKAMALVYAAVKQHNGYLHVTSEPAGGAEFVLCFPVVRKEQDVEESAAPDAAMPRGTESILVVDDQETQRALASKLLTRLGYKVTVAMHGRHALELFGKGPESPFHLMLLDMVMEDGFDGLDTYSAVLSRFPNQKCIIVSGYAPSERSQEAGALGASRFLAKPYTLESLAGAVRAELDS